VYGVLTPFSHVLIFFSTLHLVIPVATFDYIDRGKPTLEPGSGRSISVDFVNQNLNPELQFARLGRADGEQCDLHYNMLIRRVTGTHQAAPSTVLLYLDPAWHGGTPNKS